MTTQYHSQHNAKLPTPAEYSRSLDSLPASDQLPADLPSRLIIAACLGLSFFVAFCFYKLTH